MEDLGVEGFTIRALSARAGVTPRTLYNAFGSKEDIIAAAIEQYFLVLLEGLAPPPRPEDLDGVVERMGQIAEAIIGLRRYSSAMIGVFFSPATDPRIHDSLVRISRIGSGHWFRAAESAKVLRPMSAARRDALSALGVNAGYANVGDWVCGRIGDHEFKRRSQVNSLIIAFALLRPEFQRQARQIIDRLFQEEET